MITRRAALQTVTGMLGYIYGQSATQNRGGEMRLILDNIEVIRVMYRGQQVNLTPSDILTAIQPVYRK